MKYHRICLIISKFFLRSNETEEARQKRKENDKNAQKARYEALSPNSRRIKNRKKYENRKLKRNLTKITSMKKEEIPPVVQSKIAPIVQEPKLSEYERIRQRNIEEREKLFQKMKISELKAQAAVGIPKDKTISKKH